MGKPIPASGKKPAPQQQYRDDPDAVSMHTTRSDYEYDEVPELPSYSDSEAAAADSNGHTGPPQPELPSEPYVPIAPPSRSRNGWIAYNNNKRVNVNETTIRMDERLSDPGELHGYVTSYLSIAPPRPGIRIHGYHYQTVHRNDNKRETERVIDFDVGFSLQSWLRYRPAVPGSESSGPVNPTWVKRVANNSDKVHRGSWRATRAKGYKQDVEVGDLPKPDLMEWCEDYCNSTSALKIFRTTRDVTGLDETYLRASLEHLVRSTHYRGNIDITFPIEERHVDIYSPSIINRWRISWVRYIFYLTFLWIFTWPILFFATKRWNVYKVEWRFSWLENEHMETEEGRMVRQVRKFTTISEKSWLEKHQNLVKSLVLDKFQGDATALPTDVQPREGNESRGGSRRPLVQTGSRNVDAAVGFLQGGVDVWNTLQGRRGAGRRDDEGWGADST
jgi:hypothetical protein